MKQNTENKILKTKYRKVKELGYIEKGTGKHQSNIVYSKYGLCPTLSASLGVKQPGIFFIENE